MPISVVSATVIAPNVVRVQFSTAFNQDTRFYERSNYAFRTRFGTDIALYTKAVTPHTSSIADLTLQDAMLTGGNYELSVSGVSAISDGIVIENGGGVRTAQFTGDGEPLEAFDIRRRIPPYLNSRFGSLFHAVLAASGKVNATLAGQDPSSAIQEAASAMKLRTATGNDLGVIGANYGVSRPDYATNNDDLFRQLIPIFSTKRKAVINIFYEALTVIFGPSATAGWKIFEINPNELTIELPADLFFGLGGAGIDSATYLHDGPVDSTSTSVGVNFLADTTQAWTANEWVGGILVDSAHTSFTITANTATTLTVSGTPASGKYSILLNGATTYMGDYFCADASVDGGTVGDNIIVLFQATVLDDVVSRLKASGINIVVVVRG